MKHVRAAILVGIMLTISQVLGGFVEIGSGTSWSSSTPLRGYYDYSWSQTIYLQSDIGVPCVITGLAYHVSDFSPPANYVMLNQRVYLKQTQAATFSSGDYDDPATTAFTQVFDGQVTWDGSGWQGITLATPFVYDGTGSLIVYWQNHDGSGATGYPRFHFSSETDCSKSSSANGSFPTSTASVGQYVPHIRLYWSSTGPWNASDPQPANEARAVALDAAPTLTWSNHADVVHNALYFSTDQNAVVNTSPAARVLYDGTTAYSSYTRGAALAPATTYYWRVLEETALLSTLGPVWSFTTEATPITSFPWHEGFENGGAMPDYWSEEHVINATNWQFQAGGSDGHPAGAHEGIYNAALFGSGAKTMLVPPVMDLSGSADPILVFWHTQAISGGAQDELRVYYRTSRAAPWTVVPGGEFTSDFSTWTRATLHLPSPSATYYIGFEGTVNGCHDVCMDDVEVQTEYTAVTLDVYDCNGDALGAAPFSLYAPAGAATPTDWGKTDSTGKATVLGLAPGPVRYRVDHAFHNIADGTVTAVAGASTTQRVDLVAATHLTGVIREAQPDGPRIEGAVVSLHSPAPESLLVAWDSTDTFGRYHLSRVTGGDYTLSATHPAYVEASTGVTVTVSAAHDLELEPLPEEYFDVYVQVHGALSGWPIEDASVTLFVSDEFGSPVYGETLVTDTNAFVCFRGVPEGNALFSCSVGGTKRWWHSYSHEAGWIANDKLVMVRLKPKKCTTSVQLTFTPTTPWGGPKPLAPYVQNFWIEARGYDPAGNDLLYPARTELSDHNGTVTFKSLPSLPTRITVRRPGFTAATLQLTPDVNGVFPMSVQMTRPAITPGTAWELSVQQSTFRELETVGGGSSAAFYLDVDGIPGSNTEGYEEHDRYVIDRDEFSPFRASTAHGEMSAWGQGRYMVSPGSPGYMMMQRCNGFSYMFDFQPQLIALVGSETNRHTFQATVPPATIEGTLFAADRLTPKGETVYRPKAAQELRFVVHEAARYLYTPGHGMRTVTTDTNGNYRIEVPPGCYGIEIPGMSNYWGRKVEMETFTGWGSGTRGWPYAYANDWHADAVSSAVYDGKGIGLGSSQLMKLDLYVNKVSYAVETPVTEASPLSWRLVYRSPNGATQSTINVNDCLESQTRVSLSGPQGGSVPVQRSPSGMCVIWTNLPGGSYQISGENHAYLSSETAVAFNTFTWGNYPGAPPSTEPPYGDTLDDTPLPMELFQTDPYLMESDEAPTNAPTVAVVYATGDPENPLGTTYRQPIYVAYHGLSNAVYNTGQVDATRAFQYYVEYQFTDGTRSMYKVPASGPCTVDTTSPKDLVQLPVAAYNMDVIAIATDNPDETIDGVPFSLNNANYTTPHTFTNLRTTASVGWSNGMSSAWVKGNIRYQTDPTTSPLHVLTTLFCKPRVKVIGTVLNAASSAPIQNAVLELVKADGRSSGVSSRKSSTTGEFYLNYAYTRGPHLLRVTAPGYLPYCERIVLRDLITGTGGSSSYKYFIADAGTQQLTRVTLGVAKDEWNRRGSVLHGVESAGNAEQPETSAAVKLTVSSSAVVTTQTYTVRGFDGADGSPGTNTIETWEDAVVDIWLVDARYKDTNDKYQPYQPATPTEYFPVDIQHMPPATDPEKVRGWLSILSNANQVFMKLKSTQPATSISATGTVSVAELRAGQIRPVLVARAKWGGYALIALETNLIDSVALPRWLAFAADTFASIAGAQSTYDDLKGTYAAKIPDGKMSALPKLTGGISEDDGYLTYAYGLGIEWEEGAEAPAKGGLGLGPGMLGLKFEAGATVGFEGESRKIAFEVNGKVGKEDIDLQDYAPAFLEKLGIEGSINKVGGIASTKRSNKLSDAQWAERELSTTVGAYIDVMLRYNLEGITGKIPYVGPLLTLADKTNALKLWGRLDAGGRIQNTSIWRTIEPDRADRVGEPIVNPYATRPMVRTPDDEHLSSSRHCFGGQENRSGVHSNDFKLGVSFAAGFEGSAAGDHLNVHAGIEITGNSNDVLVAGEPSLVITPNTFGDWPPIKRVQGDVNAFIRAKLDVYITEIEKNWTINLARIDHQFTTESTLTMADLSVNSVENPLESTEFTGQRPIVVRNMPRGSSYAMAGDMLVFGMYNRTLRRTDLVVSLADGNGFAVPTTIATDVEGLGLIRLTEIGFGRYLLVWEERPGLAGQSEAYSVLHSALYDGAWDAGQTVAALHSYVTDMAVFASSAATSLVYLQSPDNHSGARTTVRAVSYNAGADAWGSPMTVSPLSLKRDAALACAGWQSPEPGRMIYARDATGIQSIYWDGTRSSVPSGNTTRQLTLEDSRRVALCPGGTNETLYAAAVLGTGSLQLYRYLPDSLREPSNPGYDWNGRPAAIMWPHVAALATIGGRVEELANGWLPDCGKLLCVWSHLGALNGNWVAPTAPGTTADITITCNSGGAYRNVQIVPTGGSTARVAARFVSPGAQDLRVFTVNAEDAVMEEDVDGDGQRDNLELALVDADPDDDIESVRDVSGTADFDGDGFDNATEWAAGTRADLAASYPRLGLSIETAVACACEDGLLPGSMVVNRGDSDPAATDLTVHYSVHGTATEGDDYAAIARTVVVPSNMTYATIIIQPLADDLAEAHETVEITLQPNAAYSLGVDTQAVVTVVETRQGVWLRSMFTPEQIADVAISGGEADPDRDGIPNALELALGLDPLQPNPCELDLSVDGTTVSFRFTHDPEIEGSLISIAESTSMTDSTWLPAGAVCVWRESRADGLEDVYYQVSTDLRSTFYRLHLRIEE